MEWPKSFRDAIHGLPCISSQVQDDLNDGVRAITNYVIWDLYTYDRIEEDLINTIGRNDIYKNVGVATTSTLDNAPTSNQPTQWVHVQLPPIACTSYAKDIILLTSHMAQTS